jgi:hypothetical protein
MNNTKRTLAIVAVLTAATLVVGTAGSFATKTANNMLEVQELKRQQR